MALTDPANPLAPAPGRHVVPLGGSWTAVLLHLLPGGPVEAVGLFRAGELEVVIDEPDEARQLARRLSPS
jgi:hypothetical protein